jgi:DNA-binding transcriptional LysR family regulator
VARLVGYTPSAVSQSLAQLEREVGVPLLERDGRRVRLTPAARSLVARTDRVLSELDAAEAELAAEEGSVRGSVVIGAFPSAAAGLVVPAVARLSARHTELACTIREHEPEDGIPLLRSGELDLLVSESYDDVPPRPGGWAREPPADERAAHARARPARSTRRASRWRSPASSTRPGSEVWWARSSERCSSRSVARPDSTPASCTGLTTRCSTRPSPPQAWGVGMLPAMACGDSGSVRFARIEPSPRRHLSALLRRGSASRPALAATLAALRELA